MVMATGAGGLNPPGDGRRIDRQSTRDARGQQTHRGEAKVRFYANTLARLRKELPRKRKKPVAVHFSPSSDPFRPVPDVLNMAYDVFRFLSE